MQSGLVGTLNRTRRARPRDIERVARIDYRFLMSDDCDVARRGLSAHESHHAVPVCTGSPNLRNMPRGAPVICFQHNALFSPNGAGSPQHVSTILEVLELYFEHDFMCSWKYWTTKTATFSVTPEHLKLAL